MNGFQAIANRVEVEAPRGEYTDAAMMRDYGRIASLFTDDGIKSFLNYAIYHDRYRRTPEGWKFAERVYEVRYLDTTPLAGSAHETWDARRPATPPPDQETR